MTQRDTAKIGIIGLGRMGRCLVKGMLESGNFKASQFLFTTAHPETASLVAKELGIRAVATNAALVKEADLVILAIKPQNTREVLGQIADSLDAKKCVVSIVASISTAEIEKVLKKGTPVLRAMPNTPALVGEGITALCRGQSVESSHVQKAEAIFSPVGKIIEVDEKHMDAVTGLSGCGPAYVYLILESLMDAGIKVGLPREVASELAGQTMLGAAKMLLTTKRHPAALKDEVTTPAGCTIDGLLELEEGKVRISMIRAVVQATKRARILAKRAKL